MFVCCVIFIMDPRTTNQGFVLIVCTLVKTNTNTHTYKQKLIFYKCTYVCAWANSRFSKHKMFLKFRPLLIFYLYPFKFWFQFFFLASSVGVVAAGKVVAWLVGCYPLWWFCAAGRGFAGCRRLSVTLALLANRFWWRDVIMTNSQIYTNGIFCFFNKHTQTYTHTYTSTYLYVNIYICSCF